MERGTIKNQKKYPSGKFSRPRIEYRTGVRSPDDWPVGSNVSEKLKSIKAYLKFCSEMKLETWKPVNPEENLQVAEDQTEEDFAKSDSFEANDSAIDDLLHDEQDSLKITENASNDGGPPVKRKKATKKQPVRDPRTIILGQKADI